MEKQTVKTLTFNNVIGAMQDILGLHRSGRVEESVKLFESVLKEWHEHYPMTREADAPIRKDVMGMRKPFGQRELFTATALKDIVDTKRPLGHYQDILAYAPAVKYPAFNKLTLTQLCREIAETQGQLTSDEMPIVALDDGMQSDAYLGKGITTIPIGHGNSHNREMFARGHAHELDSNNFKHPISLGWSTSDSNTLLGTPVLVVMLDDDAFARPARFAYNPNVLFSATEAGQGMKNSVNHHESAISKLQAVFALNDHFYKIHASSPDLTATPKRANHVALENVLRVLLDCITKEPNHWVETNGKTFYQNYREYLIRDLPRCGDMMQILTIINKHVTDFKLITDLLEITLDVSKNVSDPVLGTPDKYTDEYLAGLTGDELIALAENIHKMYHYSAGRGQPTPRYDIDNFRAWVNIRNKAIHRFNWM